jgi:hypothetical protein
VNLQARLAEYNGTQLVQMAVSLASMSVEEDAPVLRAEFVAAWEVACSAQMTELTPSELETVLEAAVTLSVEDDRGPSAAWLEAWARAVLACRPLPLFSSSTRDRWLATIARLGPEAAAELELMFEHKASLLWEQSRPAEQWMCVKCHAANSIERGACVRCGASNSDITHAGHMMRVGVLSARVFVFHVVYRC